MPLLPKIPNLSILEDSASIEPLVAPSNKPCSALTLPLTSSFSLGVAVPIPTLLDVSALPESILNKMSVPAPSLFQSLK